MPDFDKPFFTQESNVPEQIRINTPRRYAPIAPPLMSGIEDINQTPDVFSELDQLSREAQGSSEKGVFVTDAELLANKRYKTYNPTLSNPEDFAAYGQGWTSKMINGVGKGLLLTGTTFLQSTVGLVNGLAQWGITGKASSFYNNDLNKWVDDINKKAEDFLPNYYSEKEKNARWYSPDKLFTANFLWDGIVKNMGFAAGAALSGSAFAGILRAIPLTAKLFSVGKAAETLAATERGLLSANSAAETLGQIKSLSDKFLGNFNILNPGGRALVSGLATSGEASFEAYNNMNEFRNQLIDEYKQLHEGQEPTGFELDKINKLAEKVGNITYLLNVALLSGTNYIQFPKILGSSYKAEKGVINALTKETGTIIKEGEKFVSKPVNKTLHILNEIRKYPFSVSEGFEEGAQFAIQKGTEDYYDKRYKNENTSILESLYESIKQVGSDEGMENVIIGGLSGALMMGRGKYLEYIEKKKNTESALSAKEGVNAGLNTRAITDFTKETFDALNRGVVLQEERVEDLKRGDIKSSKDKEADYIINYLTPRIKYGRFDLVKSDIEDLRKLASSEEGFIQLQKEGKALQDDTSKAFLNRLNHLESVADNMKSLYQSLNMRYGGVITDKGEKVYDADIMNKMLYAAMKVSDFDSRITNLSTIFADTDINILDVIDDINKGNVDKYNEAVRKILSTEDIFEDKKQELGEALRDIKDMMIDRKYFLQEYNDIQRNPTKYKMETSNLKPEQPTKITVKDKTGERDITVGEEYYLGSIDYVDKEGVKRKRFPRLTVLGENEDGTIKIKDVNGQIRDINKSELEQYKIGKVSDVDKSENSRFYFRNVIKFPDTKVFWNTGKDKAGKIEGVLEYDSKSDKLFFVYEQKGIRKSKEIGIDQFKPKEGYKEGVFSFERALSNEDIKDIESRASSGKTTLDKEARRGNRIEILNKLYNSILERSEKTNELLEKKKAELENIKKELDALEDKVLNAKDAVDKRFKKLTFKPAIREAIAAASRLDKLKENLEKEIAILEEEKAQLDVEKADILPYIQDMAENIDELPSSSTEFLKELREQRDLLEESILNNSIEIESLQRLVGKVQEALDSAMSFAANLVKQFKKKYKGAPTSIEPTWEGRQTSPDTFSVQLTINSEWANFLEKHPNFLEEKPNYKEDLKQLEELVAQIEDLDIIPNERGIKELSDKINEIQAEVEEAQKRLKAMNKIIATFEDIAAKHRERKEQETKLANNKNLQNRLLGTHTKRLPTNFDNENYEPARKKSDIDVVTSTITSSSFNKPHQIRANNFGFRWAKFDEKKKNSLRAVTVTINTEDEILPGLIEHLFAETTEEQRKIYKPEETIAVVIVNDEGKLVDEFGNALSEEQLEDKLNNAIYQVMPTSKLTATYDGKVETMFRKTTPEDIRLVLQEQYVKWRENELKKTKLSTPQRFEASFGTPEYITYTNEKGLTVIDYSARTSVEDAGFVDNFEDRNVIFVSTLNDTITEGKVTFNNSLGKVFLKLSGTGLIKLQNRRFNKTEANVIFDVIHQISKNIFRQYEKNVSKEEIKNLENENKRLFKWLNSVIYWGIPKDPVTKERKEPGYNSIWFEDSTLHISGMGAKFEFTPSGLEANRNQIITLLEGMYHDVDNSLTKNNTWSNSYEQIIGIDKDGQPIVKLWNNYQSYLLSSEGRKNDEIPLTTVYKPLVDKNDVNRKGIYFTLLEPEYVISEKKTVKKSTPAPEKSTPKVEPKPEPTISEYVLDGTTVNKMQLGEFGSVNFTFDVKVFIESGGKKGLIVNADNDLQKIMSNLMSAKGYDQSKAGSVILGSVLAKLKPQIDAYSVPKQEVVDNVPAEVHHEWDNYSIEEDDEDSEYRKLLVDNATRFEEENWTELEKWLKANFPNIPVYRVKNMIQATNGKQAWGMLHNAAIYLYEHAEAGTAYHEVFEAVWKMLLTPEEKVQIAKEFRSRKGSYIDRFTGASVKYSEATDQQMKEELAEEFRDYRLTGKLTKVEKGKSWIGRMFYELMKIIKSFFVGDKAAMNTQKLFERIGSGYYKEYNPFQTKLAFANKGFIDIDNAYADDSSDLRVSGIPADQLNDIIQHMTYITLVRMIEKDESLFKISEDLQNGLKRKQLYEDLNKEILSKIRSVGRQYETALSNGEIGRDVAAREIAKLKTLWMNVKNQWPDIIKKHEEYLLSYGIEFDENDQTILKDEDNSGKGDYQDARKIDSFRKANSAIKLLLATVPVMGENGKTKKSSIGGVITLPMSEVFITLKNRLYDATDIEQMFERLHDLAVEDPNYERIYKRLVKTNVEKSVNFNRINREGLHLVSAFWKSMKSQQPDVAVMYVLSSGEVIIGDANLANATRQSKRIMFNNIISKIKNGTSYFSYSNGSYSATSTLKNYKLDSRDLGTYIRFLDTIGIEFTQKELKEHRNKLDKFKEAVEGIYASLSRIEGIKYLTGKTLNIEKRLTQLAEIRAAIDNPEFESTYFNINGERVQTFLGGNIVSNLHDVISKLTNSDELLDTQYSYLLSDVFSQGSLLMKRMFNVNTGKRIPNTEYILKPAYIDGTINEEKGKKKESSKLTKKERFLQDMNMNAYGYYSNLVPGDASIEHYVHLHKKDNPFVTEDDINSNKHLEIFKDYFISEVKLARDNRQVVKGRNSRDLRFFKDIIIQGLATPSQPKAGEDIYKEIMSKQNDIFTPEELYEGYKREINKALNNFIKQDVIENIELLKKYNIIYQDEQGLAVDGLSVMENVEITEKSIADKMEMLSINYMIANIELHKVIYSDPYQYSDELKRIKNFNSPKQALLHGSSKISEALNRKYNEGYGKKDIGYTDFTREHFRTVTLGDVLSNDELNGYEDPYEETDGGGYITLKANRVFGIRSGEWTEDNERQYRYDIAYEKYIKGIELSEEERQIFDPAKNGKDNPGIKSTYTPRKPCAAGNKDSGRDYNDILLDKYALAVLSFRVLHQINPTSNAIKLYNKMQREDVDYGVYSTGRKVGSEVISPLYNDKGEFNNESFETPKQKKNAELPQSIIKVPFSIIGVQAEVPSKDTPKTTQGSQITKLATMDFLDAGVPIDFMEDKDFEDRFVEWSKLNDNQKQEISPLYKEIIRNQKILEERIMNGYHILLEKLGINETPDGYEIENKDKLFNTLKSEILKQEVNDNIIDILDGFKQGDIIIEATPAYNKIRNILLSVADRNITSPKVNGGMKVQIPSTLLESERVDVEIINGKPVYKSNILKFYKNADGERVCEIMIGRWFKSDMTDEELLHYFNSTEEGKKALSGIGFRIPTQKQNSIDRFVVAKFLPKEFGDSVVVPSALVKKAGSDFDIDKLSIYLKNLVEDMYGNLSVVKYFGTKKETVDYYKQQYQEELRTKLANIADKDEFRYTLLSILDKLETATSTGSISDIIPSLTEEETEFYSRYIDLFNNIMDVADKKNMLPSEYMNKKILKQNQSADKLMEKLIDEELAEAYGNSMYTKALENEYIDSLENLISHPKNFENLVKPNSADQAKKLTKKINAKLGRKEVNFADVGNMLKRKFMVELRNNFVTGKYAIGIAAVNQTNNAQNQRTLIIIDPQRLSIVPEEDKVWLGDAKVKFKEFNKVKSENGEYVATLSMRLNKAGQYISDIVSQFIDGYVDISKGAWIMELGATPSTASTWLFLIKIGVPLDTVAYFMNQPIILDYLQTIENAGYNWLFIDDFVKEVSEKYTPKKVIKQSVIPSEEELWEMIGSTELSDNQKNQQLFILREFLKYAKMANHLFLVTQGSNYDTATFNDPYLIFKKAKQLEKARKTIISSVDSLLENSFVGSLESIMNQVRDALSTILISDRTTNDPLKVSVRDVIEAVLTPYVDLSDRDFVKISQKAVADLFDWAMQTNTGMNRKVAATLLGSATEKSAAEEIIAFKRKVAKDKNHPLHNNVILKNIELQKGEKEGKVDNLYIAGRDNKIYDQNQVISAFRELKQYLGDEKGGLYSKLLRLAVLQSGLTNSPIAFTQLLPYEDFKKIYNDSLSVLEDMPNLVDFYNLHVFERNNWNNTDIVPFKKDKIKYNIMGERYYPSQAFVHKNLKNAMKTNLISKVINISTLSREGDSDFITYSWESYISKQERAKRQRTGDRSHVHKGLFKKVYTVDENGNSVPLIHTSESKGKVYTSYVYKMINAWGDSYKANEFYTTEQKSVLDNDYIKVEKETEDELIAKILEGEQTISQEKPVYLPEEKTDMNIYSKLGNKTQSENVVIDEVNGRKPAVDNKKDLKTFINYSGAAQGGDTVWENIGKEFGLGKQVNYKPESLQKLTKEQLNEVENAYQQAVKDLGRKSLSADTFAGGLVRRDYLQAKAADAVFAISTIVQPNEKDPKGYVNKTNKPLVAGGTGYAVQMAINLGKPVYVFDQVKNKWFVWSNNNFVETGIPTLTQKFAGIGTREINENGKQAIRNVYEKSTQSSKPIVAYRTRGNNFLEALEKDNAIGNPWGPYGIYKTAEDGTAVKEFISWMIGEKHTDKLQDYRQAIIDKIPELKGKTILYYKDLGRPSHATALDFLINKYDWSNPKEIGAPEGFVEEKTEDWENKDNTCTIPF